MVELDFESMKIDPYPSFAALRREERWTWAEPLNMYLVSRYDDVVMVDTDDQTFSVQIPDNLMNRTIGTSMLRLDGAAHQRVRAATGEPLKRRSIRRDWSGMINGLVTLAISQLRGRDRADLMADVAAPLTGWCLCEILGLRDASAADIERWSATFIAGLINNTDDPQIWARPKLASDEVRDSVASALARVRNQPDGTVISAMAGAGLGIEEMVSNVEFIITGGFNDARDAIATLAFARRIAERPAVTALLVEESVDQSVDNMGFYNALQACFALHQSHWTVVIATTMRPDAANTASLTGAPHRRPCSAKERSLAPSWTTNGVRLFHPGGRAAHRTK